MLDSDLAGSHPVPTILKHIPNRNLHIRVFPQKNVQHTKIPGTARQGGTHHSLVPTLGVLVTLLKVALRTLRIRLEGRASQMPGESSTNEIIATTSRDGRIKRTQTYCGMVLILERGDLVTTRGEPEDSTLREATVTLQGKCCIISLTAKLPPKQMAREENRAWGGDGGNQIKDYKVRDR